MGAPKAAKPARGGWVGWAGKKDGWARAIATAGKTGKVRVISVDGNKDALTAVKSGGIDAVVAQYPYAIGLMGMEACQAAAAGKTLPANVEAPVQLVTKDNADQALAA